ncbi:competence lipoprotein, ComL, partial [mine drainage metagenome]
MAYAYYMQGMVYFPRRANPIERLFGAHLSARPPHNVRKSFAAFRTVVSQYPNSPYAHEAYQRMIFLRDRLASYNVDVARYYLERGAYVASARRAEIVVDEYQGAPAVKDALAIMILSYERL